MIPLKQYFPRVLKLASNIQNKSKIRFHKYQRDCLINKTYRALFCVFLDHPSYIYIYRMQENIMYLLCIIYKPLLSTYVRKHICLSVRIHRFSMCSILYESSQYSISIYNYLVNCQFYESICLIRKKGKH